MFAILFGKLAIGNAQANTHEEALIKARSIAASDQPPTIKHDGEAYSLEEFERLVASGKWLDKF